MRPDQLARLNELSEILSDVLLDEIDPREWPGAGKMQRDMNQQERGDRYWCKKNAAATLMIVGKIGDLARNAMLEKYNIDDAQMLDQEINAAEKEASRLLAKLQNQTGKADFDTRVHGKA